MRFFDHLFLHLIAKHYDFFKNGFGDPALIERIIHSPFLETPAKPIQIEWRHETRTEGIWTRKGVFESPFAEFLPEKSKLACIELILPDQTNPPPVCIHFAATGETGLHRRRQKLALPLAKMGIGSILLENAFYGRRKPPHQKGISLKELTDQWLMVTATTEEGKSLLLWLKENGFGVRGVSGFSLGGYVAALVASQVHEPIGVVPCFAPHNAGVAFLEGMMKGACNWTALEKELTAQETIQNKLEEIFRKMDLSKMPVPVCPEAAVILAGSKDAFVPIHSPQALHEHWQKSTLKKYRAGHVAGFLFYSGKIRKAIAESFETLQKKCLAR